MRHKVVEKPVEEGAEKGREREKEREREREREGERPSERALATTEGKPLGPNHPSRFLATPASPRRGHVAGRSGSRTPSLSVWGATGEKATDAWKGMMRRVRGGGS